MLSLKWGLWGPSSVFFLRFLFFQGTVSNLTNENFLRTDTDDTDCRDLIRRKSENSKLDGNACIVHTLPMNAVVRQTNGDEIIIG